MESVLKIVSPCELCYHCLILTYDELSVHELNMNSKTLSFALIAAGIIGLGYLQYSLMDSQKGTAVTSDHMQHESMMQENIKDGVYEAVGAYQSPGGPEKLGVKVEVKNNTIVTADVTVFETSEKTTTFQNLFKDNYSPLVVGKDIRTLKLDKVAASSLTPKGFNDAVATILKQAQG